MARQRPSWCYAGVVAIMVAIGAWGSPAFGQARRDQDVDKARQLFREARTLVDERQYAEACKRFEQSLAIERGIGTMYNLADCWERLGKTASAQAMFLSTAQAARSLSQPDRAQKAHERATALEPKLSRMLVTVGTPAEGISVWRDKKQIDQAVWGIAAPVDPGTYEIRATAPGKQPWTTRIEVPEQPTTITVTVPPLADESKAEAAPIPAKPKPAAAVSPPPERTPLPPPERPAQADSSTGSGTRIVALSMGGVGVGALVAGVVFGLDYLSKNGDAKNVCPSSTRCSQAEIEQYDQLRDDATTSRNWSYLAFGVGGAAVLGAGAIYISSSGSSSRGARLGVSPLAGARGPVGAVVRGNW